jgi:hypothetical protein
MISMFESPLDMDLLQGRQRRFHVVTSEAPPCEEETV